MRPYLSIVAASRNDDHGGDLARRTRIFVNGALRQAERHRLNCELILVEWNPPEERDSLLTSLGGLSGNEFCAIRVITVPPELHRKLKHSDKLPLFQMIAKNVGIRRARGEFVLATNVDLLFSDALFGFLASRKLDCGCLYRADRIDVDRNVPSNVSLDEQLAFCRKNALRGYTSEGVRCFSSHALTGRFSKLASSARRGFSSFAEFVDEVSRPIRRYPRLHINASGDFMLMSNENWGRIQGNPELEMYSLHLDTLALHCAYREGVRIVDLPDEMVCYHIDHEGGWTPDSDHRLYRRLRRRGVPILRMGTVAKWLDRLHRGGETGFRAGSEWGLRDHVLSEKVF